MTSWPCACAAAGDPLAPRSANTVRVTCDNLSSVSRMQRLLEVALGKDACHSAVVHVAPVDAVSPPDGHAVSWEVTFATYAQAVRLHRSLPHYQITPAGTIRISLVGLHGAFFAPN